MNAALAPDSASPLQGDALHAFLEHASDLLDQGSELQEEERHAAVAELMAQQTFAPKTIHELEQLHDFWVRLAQPAVANEVLQAHLNTVLQADPDPSGNGRVRLLLSDLHSRLQFDPPSAAALLLPTLQQLDQLPNQADAQHLWRSWQWLAEQAQAWETAEHGLDLQRAHARSNPDDESNLTFDDAMAMLQKAALSQQRGDAAAVQRHTEQAIALMRDADAEAGADQAIEFPHWMALAERLLPLAPDRLPDLLAASEQQLTRTQTETPSQASLTLRKVRVARLQAQALASRGHIEQALQWAPQGRFLINEDHDDSFTTDVLQWLQQTGRLDEAAAMALEAVLHARYGSAQMAYQMAQQGLHNDPARNVTWHLIMALVLTEEDLLQHILLNEDQPRQDLEHHLNAVRQQAPEHPMLALLEGKKLAHRRRMADALPLLERAVGQHPEWANGDLMSLLWAARFAALPLEEALNRPFVIPHGGSWCYATGVFLDDESDLARLMGGKKHLPDDDTRVALAMRYYEAGLARFEHFWATGQGSYKDAHLHDYSMLCNNLGIKYRLRERYDEATALHQKGLATSPFAEHHDGLLWSALGKSDDKAAVVEAERLWHFTQTHGYSRFDPTEHFSAVALALYQLARTDEISIWLERLDEWFFDLDEEDQASNRRDYLATLMSMLDFFSAARPELVLPRLLPLREEVRALKESYALRRYACALEAYPDRLDESLALHQEAVGNLNPEDDNEAEHDMAHAGAARVRALLLELRNPTPSKPWWKLW